MLSIELFGRVCDCESRANGAPHRECMRDRRASDLDNRMKALCDALEHAGVFDDDEQIDELLISRGPIVKGGQCTVLISTQTGSAFSNGES